MESNNINQLRAYQFKVGDEFVVGEDNLIEIWRTNNELFLRGKGRYFKLIGISESIWYKPKTWFHRTYTIKVVSYDWK